MSPSHARLFPRRGGRSRIPRPGLKVLSAPASLAGRLEDAETFDRREHRRACAEHDARLTGSQTRPFIKAFTFRER